jgi:hypothetical protein
MSVYIRVDRGGRCLSDENEKTALDAGCAGLHFGEWEPTGAVSLMHSTTGWTGIYRDGVRLARFQDFARALSYALRQP